MVARSNISTPPAAIAIPSKAPTSDSTMASAKNGAVTRQRLAPKADRTAASLVRNAARARRRLATLAHAISRTKMVAICIAAKTGTISSPIPCSANDMKTIPTPSFDSGYSCANRWATSDKSSRACSIVTPSLRRPNTANWVPDPLVGLAFRVSRRGIHSSCFCGNMKPSGITPITVACSPFTFSITPITLGSESYRVAHAW